MDRSRAATGSRAVKELGHGTEHFTDDFTGEFVEG
jgi:hypothetical protein